MTINIFSTCIAVSLGFATVEKFGVIGVAFSFAIATIVQQILMLFFVKIRVGVWTHVGAVDMGMIINKIVK